jgi:anti-anti-sigma regulatory factor
MIVVRIMLTHIQTVGTLSSIYLSKGTQAFQEAVGITQLVGASPMQAGPIECTLRLDYYSKFYGTVSIPFFMMLVAVACLAVEMRFRGPLRALRYALYRVLCCSAKHGYGDGDGGKKARAESRAAKAARVREELNRTLEEMSTPVMPIWDGILLLPLIGVVDSSRTDHAVTKTLERISETRARVFLLDISGVPAVDTAVANQLLKITKATQLMGCETVISGLSPAIARTMVELGVEVGQVRTTATLRDAFALALRKMNAQAAATA